MLTIIGIIFALLAGFMPIASSFLSLPNLGMMSLFLFSPPIYSLIGLVIGGILVSKEDKEMRKKGAIIIILSIALPFVGTMAAGLLFASL